MRRAFFFLVSVLLLGSKTWASDNEYQNFEEGSESYILADNVILRAIPDTSGAIIDKFSSGTRIWILGNSGISCTSNEYKADWIEVQVFEQEDSNSSLRGFVCGTFLATKAIRSQSDASLLYLYGLSRVSFDGAGNNVTLRLTVVHNGVQKGSLEFPAIGQIATSNEAESLGSKDVPGVKDILKIHFSDGYCGGASGNAYFFWDGSRIFPVKSLNQGFDAPSYFKNYFLFPADEGGQAERILQHEISGSYDERNKDQIDSQTTTTWRWMGHSLVKLHFKRLR